MFVSEETGYQTAGRWLTLMTDQMFSSAVSCPMLAVSENEESILSLIILSSSDLVIIVESKYFERQRDEDKIEKPKSHPS